MKIRTPLFLIVAIVAGLFWSLGSNVHLAVTHFVAPPLFGIAVAALWRQSATWCQLLLLFLFIGATELVRLIMYSGHANGWHYISSDSQTQIALATSFGLQLVIGVATWAGARLFVRRHEMRTA
jgi:hypothetical protein